MSARQVRVDADAVRRASTEFVAAARRLSEPKAAADTGPGWQPSTAAVTAVTAGIDHVTDGCAKRLVDYADQLRAAATTYAVTDQAVAAALRPAVPPVD